jgi:hypothetical protein
LGDAYGGPPIPWISWKLSPFVLEYIWNGFSPPSVPAIEQLDVFHQSTSSTEVSLPPLGHLFWQQRETRLMARNLGYKASLSDGKLTISVESSTSTSDVESVGRRWFENCEDSQRFYGLKSVYHSFPRKNN